MIGCQPGQRGMQDGPDRHASRVVPGCKQIDFRQSPFDTARRLPGGPNHARYAKRGGYHDERQRSRTGGQGLELTARIVSAYAGKAALSPAELVTLIGTVSQALSGVGNQPAGPKAEALTPAVPVKKSVLPDFIVCLEDGKKLKML